MADETSLMLSHKEMITLLIKHKNIHEGLFDIAMEFQMAIGAIGTTPETVLPGAMLGVSRVGLARAERMGPHTVNAAEVNPAKPPRKTAAKK